jgi:YfiH family protein
VVLTSKLLAGLPGIEHGFGTRHGPVSQNGMASLTQIHSARVLVADAPASCIGQGDALVTNRRGLAVSIRTADCLPILLAEPVSGAVAAVHAGWRGTVARIIQAAVENLRAEFGANPRGIYAAIGPAIGVCCYEVGAEVARQFGLAGPGNLDLAAENRRQLIDAGVLGAKIEILGLCTKCDPAQFHSYRRDGDAAGRMISYIARS